MHLNTVAFEHDMPVLIDKAFSSGLLPGDLSGRRGSAISSFNVYLRPRSGIVRGELFSLCTLFYASFHGSFPPHGRFVIERPC